MNKQLIVEKILKLSGPKIGEAVGELLGHKLEVTHPVSRFKSKEEFFFEAESNLVLTEIQVGGELSGEMYFLVTLKDSILLGGTLIMLPEPELESHMASEEFGEDEADAYGEIANIIIGILNDVFQEVFPEKLHLKKGETQPVNPNKVDTASPKPVPDQKYLAATYAMSLEKRQLGAMQMLLPAELLGLVEVESEDAVARKKTAAASETIKAVAESKDAWGEQEKVRPQQKAGAAQADTKPTTDSAGRADGPPVVLIVAEAMEAAAPFEAIAVNQGYTPKVIQVQDNMKAAVAGENIRGSFLVLNEVNDRGIAAVIKVKSACGNAIPLITAGPDWTRKKVLQAVRYGACDIVVTPAEPDDIKEKLVTHLGVSPAQAA